MAFPLLTLVLVGSENVKAATIADAVADFSPTSNPNGAWSYGQEATLGGAFSLLTFNDSAHGLDAWATDANYPGGDATPYIAHNPSGSTITFSSFSVPVNELQLQPGPSGQFAVVRWTSTFATPTTITITGQFSSEDNHTSPTPAGTTSDAHVLRDGVALFNTNINGIGVTSPYSLTTTVSAGDTIDFAVGYGSNLDYSFDSTGLQAQISTIASTVPEPGSLLLLLSGSGLLMLGKRRTRR